MTNARKAKGTPIDCFLDVAEQPSPGVDEGDLDHDLKQITRASLPLDPEGAAK